MTTYNTGNPIGSTDARDLYDNAQNLDNFANGTAASYTDRRGVSRRSLAGIDATADLVLSGLGYAPPVAYAAGISLTLTTQTIEYAGEVYAPKVANLPFTTSGTFETAKFRLIQGVASADLSSGGGAAMVGYTPAGTGAVATTVESNLRQRISVKDFGAVGEGGEANATINTEAFNKALAACQVRRATIVPGIGHTYEYSQNKLYVPAGEYFFNGPVVQVASESLVIEFDEEAVIRSVSTYLGAQFIFTDPWKLSIKGGKFVAPSSGNGYCMWIGAVDSSNYNVEQSQININIINAKGFKSVFPRFQSQSCNAVIEGGTFDKNLSVMGIGTSISTATGLVTDGSYGGTLINGCDSLHINNIWVSANGSMSDFKHGVFNIGQGHTFFNNLFTVPYPQTAKEAAWVNYAGLRLVVDNSKIGGEPGSFSLLNWFGDGPVADAGAGVLYHRVVSISNTTLNGFNPNLPSTTLSAPISISDTTIPLVSTAGFPARGMCRVDSEDIYYAGISGNFLTNCLRDATGSGGGTSHLSGTTLSMPFSGVAIRLWKTAALYATPANITLDNVGGQQMSSVLDWGSTVTVDERIVASDYMRNNMVLNTSNCWFQCISIGNPLGTYGSGLPIELTNSFSLNDDLRKDNTKAVVWHNVTSSRALGSIYTNTTRKSKTISVTIVKTETTGGYIALEIVVSGSRIAYETIACPTGVWGYATRMFEVPADGTYMVTTSGSSGSTVLSAWVELY